MEVFNKFIDNFTSIYGNPVMNDNVFEWYKDTMGLYFAKEEDNSKIGMLFVQVKY